MRVATLSSWWRGGSDNRSREEIDDEIRAELEFHLTQLEEEFARQGLPFSEAKALARERFGDPDEYFQHCRRINMHNRLLLQRVLLATSLVLVAITGLLGWQVVNLSRSQRSSMVLLESMKTELETLRQSRNVGSFPTAGIEQLAAPIVGRVIDAEGQPIAGAHVLATIKTWPGNIYRQQSMSAVTDEHGEYKMPQGLPHPVLGKRAFQITVVAKGYTFESQYVDDPPSQEDSIQSFDFRLDPVAPVKARLVHSDGSPLACATLFPGQRTTLEGEQYLLYFVGSEPVHVVCDDQGYADLPGLAPGDEVTLYVRPADADWQKVDLSIELWNDPLLITVPNSD